MKVIFVIIILVGSFSIISVLPQNIYIYAGSTSVDSLIYVGKSKLRQLKKYYGKNFIKCVQIKPYFCGDFVNKPCWYNKFVEIYYPQKGIKFRFVYRLFSIRYKCWYKNLFDRGLNDIIIDESFRGSINNKIKIGSSYEEVIEVFGIPGREENDERENKRKLYYNSIDNNFVATFIFEMNNKLIGAIF